MGGEEKDVRSGERRSRRFSLRRLFYSPLLANPLTHRSAKKGRSGNEDNRSMSSMSDREASITGSFRHPRAASRGSSASETSQTMRNKSILNESTLDMSGSVECPLCLEVLPKECFPELFVSQCNHISCHSCLFTYLRIQISESRTNISCPQCSEPMHPNDIHSILNDPGLWTKYEDFMLRRVLANDPDTRWCPAPDCTYAVIATGCAGCPKLQCERQGCNTYFCYHCKAMWHPDQTCDKAREERSPNIGTLLSYSVTHEPVHREEVKPCPRCRVPIVKMNDGSCNHMTCAVCGTEFCWLCMKEISDLHYLSPSGCTFWGSKPWSRKKKILWQLGTLVGAPVGIGLVAGIAVPAMVIGIPVWVGRKLKAHYKKSNKHKRRIAITGGVVASLVVSPVLAGLAVGIGVPILLAYVYGVVPVSLCRNGLCGVSTSRGPQGVRLDFDEDAYTLSRGRSQDTPSVELTDVRVANPSIGEVSFGLSASLSLGSAGRDSDRESASNTAIPAASLTGSIGTGSELLLGHSGPTRLEVQADISGSKRHSLSSESASVTVSLSQCSAADDRASNVAMAGSLCNYRVWSEEHQPSLSPMSSFSGDELSTNVPSRRSNRRRYKDRQMSETASVWSGDERVRFDDNVSFIDDVIPVSDDGCPMCAATTCSCPNRSRQHRIRLQVHIEREEECGGRVVIPVKFPMVRETSPCSLPHVEEVTAQIRSSQSLSQLQSSSKLSDTLRFYRSSPCIPSSC